MHDVDEPLSRVTRLHDLHRISLIVMFEEFGLARQWTGRKYIRHMEIRLYTLRLLFIITHIQI